MFAVNGAGRPNQIQAAQIKRHSISINLPPQPPCKLQVYFLFSNQRVVTRTNIKRMIKAVFGIQFYFGRRKKITFYVASPDVGFSSTVSLCGRKFWRWLAAVSSKQHKTKWNKKEQNTRRTILLNRKVFLFSPFSVYFNIFFVCTLKTHSANRKNRTCTEQFLIWEKWKHTEIGHWTHWRWYLKQIRLIYQLSFDAISLILN